MKKIKHIKTGLVIDLEEIKRRAGTENQLVIKRRNESGFDFEAIENGSGELKEFTGPKDNFIQVERYEFDFGLCGLLEFESADQVFSKNELGMLFTALEHTLKTTELIYNDDQHNLRKKVYAMFMEARKNELR